ncbi:MAG TPA: helix-turn-helix domain-containing protein [Candidatus Binatia bacterium]|nr:helix-turn-helix domain-containing protein [Candidatus Binatia bacterium]
MTRKRSRPALQITSLERAELVRRASRTASRRGARRARVILLLADGATWQQVMKQLRCSRAFVARWARRFRQARIGGMRAWHHGGESHLEPRIERRILRGGEQRAAGEARRSTREIARECGVSHMTVHRLWLRHGLLPPRRGA